MKSQPSAFTEGSPVNPAHPEPQGRWLLHPRKLTFEGYLREDGLFDIEARLQDITAVPTDMPFASLPPGGTIHDMRLVMTIDGEMVVRQIRATTEVGATPYCAEINDAYASLAGLKIGLGFKQQVKARVGGVRGCTHLTELMGGLGTAAMQTLFSIRRAESSRRRAREPNAPIPKPWVIDTCHAYRMDGEAVQIMWPPARRIA